MEAIIQLDDQLYNRAQELAQASGQSLDAFIAQSLQETVGKQTPPPLSEKRTHLVQNSEMRLQPGIDISNSAELLEIMEKGLDVSQRH